MLVVVSDTHGTDGHRLAGRTLAAVREADLVAHVGDFTSERALAAFRSEADRLFAVHGNADDEAVRRRLPDRRTFSYGGVRFAMTHRSESGATGLAMYGRQEAAAVVVHGHSHRPSVERTDDVALLNPGSHAQPRGNRPAHAELCPADGGLRGLLREPDGTTVARFAVEREA